MKGYINDVLVTFDVNESVLQVARKHDIFIPTLCELADIGHTPGSCRVCLVEVPDSQGKPQLLTSCNVPMTDGLVVQTNTAFVREARRIQVELLLSDHNQNCAACSRHGDCELLDICYDVGVSTTRFGTGQQVQQESKPTDSQSISRDMSKCVRCLRCKAVCQLIQGVDALHFEDNGPQSCIALHDKTTGEGRLHVDDRSCISCGQCTLVCPTGALSAVDHTEQVTRWFSDPEITTIVQFAPAVRISIGEEFGITAGVNTEGKVISALKLLGADHVVDTTFTADLVIMEEGSEFIQRLTQSESLPMFTSCCPGWVNYVELSHPEVLPHLSSTKSPQQCLGAIAKTYMAERIDVDPQKIRTISIMPCTAKKDECSRPDTVKAFGKEVDIVLTTREFADLVRRSKIDFAHLVASEFTNPLMGEYSGAGAIFGNTGGVMEAAIRTVHKEITGEELEGIEFTPVRGTTHLREAVVQLNDDITVRAAACYGIETARTIIEDINAGKCDYDFVEVMACPGGCIAGGGQPRTKAQYQPSRLKRTAGLYNVDKKKVIRQSHKNPQIQKLYETFLEHPNSEIAHQLLHTTYTDRS